MFHSVYRDRDRDYDCVNPSGFLSYTICCWSHLQVINVSTLLIRFMAENNYQVYCIPKHKFQGWLTTLLRSWTKAGGSPFFGGATPAFFIRSVKNEYENHGSDKHLCKLWVIWCQRILTPCEIGWFFAQIWAVIYLIINCKDDWQFISTNCETLLVSVCHYCLGTIAEQLVCVQHRIISNGKTKKPIAIQTWNAHIQF